MSSRSRSRALRWLGALGILGLVIGMFPTDAPAGSKSRKIRKQIRVFEAMVDQMLVDSPNWLVQSREEARGSYVEGHGVVVTFDASLVGAAWGGDKHWWNWIWDEDRVIVLDEKGDEVDKGRGEKSKRWRERHLTKQERLYKRGKTEVIDTILDFGDLLTFAKDDEWLEIDARLRRSEYFDENDLNRLVMKVKMKDVRDYANDKLSEEKLIERIQVEES